MHLFAKPVRNIHPHLFSDESGSPEARADALRHPQFVRLGAAFLAVAVGPVLLFVAASLALWNR
jgi:hypothetical protein